ncbi:MAG: hypothetical protein ACHREM_20460 [Polyangiales bacterium]
MARGIGDDRLARAGDGTTNTMWALIGALVLGVVACKAARDGEPGGGKPIAADPAAGPSASAGGAAEDPKTQKRVTAKDCKVWSVRAGDAVVASVDFAASGCSEAARAAVHKKFDDEIVTIRGAAESTCLGHLDQTYLAGDAACVMHATDALTLRACKFAPLINREDSDFGAFLKSVHDRCALPGMAAPQPSASASASTSH